MKNGDPDADLVVRATSGDREAFASLLERHYDRIHGLAWQLMGTRADAEDVAQDVCCALVDRIGGFRGEALFSTWLCGIVVNACRDLKRRRRSFAGLTERLAVVAGLTRGPDGRDLHDAMWVRSAVARLPTAYREAVVLVAGQGLTHAEAAAILGIAEATVSWRMHEARRRLTGGAEPAGEIFFARPPRFCPPSASKDQADEMRPPEPRRKPCRVPRSRSPPDLPRCWRAAAPRPAPAPAPPTKRPASPRRSRTPPRAPPMSS